MEYFHYSDFFAFLWTAKGISVLEILSYEPISLLGELIPLNSKKVQKQLFRYFSQLDFG